MWIRNLIQEQLDHLKIDLEKAVQGALNVVVEQKRAEVLSLLFATFYHFYYHFIFLSKNHTFVEYSGTVSHAIEIGWAFLAWCIYQWPRITIYRQFYYWHDITFLLNWLLIKTIYYYFMWVRFHILICVIPNPRVCPTFRVL